MTAIRPYPGARWWKFDFHTHTPASKDTYWHAKIGTADELTPQAWLLRYMAAEIDCVAITDHNTGEWIDKLKATYADMRQQIDLAAPPEWFRELHLFPGVEISVVGGIHLLAIFDCDATSATITSLLGGVGFPAHLHGQTDDKEGAAITRASVLEVIDEVRRCGGIAIPAHVDGGKGLLRLQPDSRRCALETAMVKGALNAAGLLALEWKTSSPVYPSVWDERKTSLASVLGSDCHSFNEEPPIPGGRYTWIKMATPSLEGLRLALVDGQDFSVRRSDAADGLATLELPEHFVECIEVREAQVMGKRKPTELRLNPYFNAIIGGRGTGKSTLVHALRLAYRRGSELVEGSDAALTFKNFVDPPKGKVGGLRAETAITLQVLRYGSSYRLLWSKGELAHTVEEWDAAAKQFKPASSQAITPQRFPIRLFSQGQIAALAGESQQALLNVIDDAAGTAEQQKVLAEAKRAFLATRAQMRDLDGKLSGREVLSLSLQDVERKLARFESADHAAVLKEYQKTSRQAREVDRQFEQASELVASLKRFASETVADDLPEGLFDAATGADALAMHAIEKLHAEMTKACSSVERVAADLEQQQSQLRTKLDASDWSVRVDQAKTAYDRLKADLQQQGVSDPSEYGRLVQERQRLENENKRLDALQKQRDELKTRAADQLEAVRAARSRVSERRRQFLNSTLEGNLFVRMGLVPYGREPRTIERSLRDVLGVPEGKYNDDLFVEAQDDAPEKGVVADLLLAVNLTELPGAWDTPTLESSLEDLKRKLVAACKGQGEFGGWFNRFLKAEADKRPEFIDHILCWSPEDGLHVEYSPEGDGQLFRPIEQASAGQRAAAMLAFLLAHGTEPLVLDEPEDDLDNHLIYNLVVQQIRDNKLRRQLIIVTHNPNIVVNGDAELIHAMGFEKGQCAVKLSGSLQDERMREEVCLVMEGGKQAFERRYQRLGREI
jgi:energy-coupling factor transporter ATP-binding protein EcfA2